VPKSPPVIQYSLVIAAGLGGTTVPAPGVYSVLIGTIQTITASPYPGYVFDHWEGDASGTDPTVTVTVNQDTGVIAYFVSAGGSPPSSGGSSIFLPILGLSVSAIGLAFAIYQSVKHPRVA
jgi:uncharacterized repeat protein (TIGR02543 family)